MALARGQRTNKTLRVRVRIDPSRIAPGMDIPVETLRRYRLGLGPFSVRPVEIVVTPQQAEALRDDPILAVEDVTD